ncbi:hypothetical protein [Bacillus sp. 37MA]|nr:hypothetical protein [Bacillus sp. 37MA]
MQEHNRAHALAAYLQALAILETNQNTYVNREIREVINEIKAELNLKK